MKSRAILVLLCSCFLCASAQAYVFEFNSSGSAVVTFDGSSRTFAFSPEDGTPGPGYGFDFVVTRSEDSTLDGYRGTIAGLFAIGAIDAPGAVVQTAPVTTSGGLFTLSNLLGDTITATLTWNEIFTRDPGGSTSSGSIEGTVTLSDFTGYTGADSALAALAGSDGFITLAFSFVSPGRSLVELTTPGQIHVTGYHGDVTVAPLAAIPEPAMASGVIGLLVLGLAVAMHRTVTHQERDIDE